VLVALLADNRCIVTMSPLQPPQRLSADIEASGIPALVGSSEALSRPGVVAAARDALVLQLMADGLTTVSLPGRENGPGDAAPGVVIEMLTSGTTGPPKRIRLGETQFDRALRISVPAPPTDELFRSGVAVVTTPMVHIGGLWGVLAPLYAGRRVVLQPRFSLESWVASVALHRPRAAGLVPAALREVLSADVPADMLESLEVITSGTTFCPPELVDQFLSNYGSRVLPTYGATEFAGAVATWNAPLHEEWWARKRGAAGRAMLGVELRITDDAGRELTPGDVGHLEIRSAQTPVGPLEWLRTSDLAVVDEDQFLWIHGRSDDAIIRGGFKVQPDRVRAALERHPAVREAAVAAAPDERLGQIPVAGVELEPEHVATASELKTFCRATLTPYEVPVHIVIVDALPRTPSSKVSRVELLELITRALESDVPA